MVDNSDKDRFLPPAEDRVFALYPVAEGGSLKLTVVMQELWRRKVLILVMSALFALGGAIFSLIVSPRYVSEVVLAPSQNESSGGLPASLGGLAGLAGISVSGANQTDEAVATLRSRALLEGLILDNDLLPLLFADEWDADASKWRSGSIEDRPDIRDAVDLFVKRIRSVREDAVSGLVTLEVEWTNAELAMTWANLIVARVNDTLRERDLNESQRRLEYLNSQLTNTNLVELRSAIATLIESEIQTIMIAKSKTEYAFRVIDPAREAKKRSFPKRKLIVILAFFVGGVLGSVIVLGEWMIRRA